MAKITTYSALATAAGDEVWYVVADPGGSPLDRKVTTDVVNTYVRAKRAETVQIKLGATNTAITATGDTGVFWFAPADVTVTNVILSVGTAAASGTLTLDINQNAVTILSTKLTVDATETSSLTAAVPAVISVPAVTAGAKVSFDFDGVADSGAKDAYVTIEYVRG